MMSTRANVEADVVVMTLEMMSAGNPAVRKAYGVNLLKL